MDRWSIQIQIPLRCKINQTSGECWNISFWNIIIINWKTLKPNIQIELFQWVFYTCIRCRMHIARTLHRIRNACSILIEILPCVVARTNCLTQGRSINSKLCLNLWKWIGMLETTKKNIWTPINYYTELYLWPCDRPYLEKCIQFSRDF